MYSFYMNGYLWYVILVPSTNSKLIDRTGNLRVATTDPEDLCVYLSSALGGDFLSKVIKHELAHCVIFSYDLFKDIRHLPESEEHICNFIADYGDQIMALAKDIQSSL